MSYNLFLAKRASGISNNVQFSGRENERPDAGVNAKDRMRNINHGDVAGRLCLGPVCRDLVCLCGRHVYAETWIDPVVAYRFRVFSRGLWTLTLNGVVDVFPCPSLYPYPST